MASALQQAQAAAREAKSEQGGTNGEDGNGEPKMAANCHPEFAGNHDYQGVSHNGQTGKSPGTGR